MQIPSVYRGSKGYRRATRWGSQKAGKLEFGSGRITIIPCTILDISLSGAAIEVNSAAWFPDSFRLRIDSQNLRQSCQVKWRKGQRLGVAFCR
jgi:hypothetical protein